MRARLFWIAVVLQLAAVACVVIAYWKRNDVEIEGAYFDRAVGNATNDVSVTWQGPIAPWLIAAGVLMLGALATFALDRRARLKAGV
jgi:hypothetical protein